MNDKSKILIVDDEPVIVDMLSDYIGSIENCSVETAGNGVEALNILSKSHVDLVISDINMPEINGLELLKTVREKYPGIKRALITAYNVEDYFEYATKYDIGNIIPKTTPFKFEDIKLVINNLLTENIFGIESHFSKDCIINSRKLTEINSVTDVAKDIDNYIDDEAIGDKIRLVVVELLTNAFKYGSQKTEEEWYRNTVLEQKDALEVSWVKDSEKVGVLVADSFGKLSKKDILYWLNRQTQRDENGLPLGVFDSHGRGLYISRTFVDSLIINIKENSRTEIIAIKYFDKKFEGYKPLYINEV